MKTLTNKILLFIITILLSKVCIAQKEFRADPHRNVYLNQKNRKIEFKVLQQAKTKAKPTKFYYWYDNTDIHITQGGYSGYLLDDNYTEYTYGDNYLVTKGKFKNGLKHGVWSEWYTNGLLKEKITWKMGTVHGKRYTYGSHGELVSIKLYKYGKYYENIPLQDSVKHNRFKLPIKIPWFHNGKAKKQAK